MADVTAWVTACASTGATSTTCSAWYNNTANATCGGCISPAGADGGGVPTGATIYDDQGNPYANVPGCVAIADGNTTCAAPLAQLVECHFDACNSTACLNGTQTAYDSCITASDTGACATYLSGAQPCAADSQDGGTLGAKCNTVNEVTYVICGNGQ